MRALVSLLFTAALLAGASCEKHLSMGIPSQTDQLLCRDAFVNGYDYSTKSPAWSMAYVTKSSLKGYHSRDARRYENDEEVPRRYIGWSSAYRGSGHDHGHLTSNSVADYSIKAQQQSFLTSNLAPQDPKLNRYGWKALEKRIRDAIKRSGEGYIITGLIYAYGPQEDAVKLKYGITVPTHWYKALYLPRSKKVYGYLMPNGAVKANEIQRYVVSIDAIEEKAGVDLFPALPDALERRIEKRKERL